MLRTWSSMRAWFAIASIMCCSSCFSTKAGRAVSSSSAPEPSISLIAARASSDVCSVFAANAALSCSSATRVAASCPCTCTTLVYAFGSNDVSLAFTASNCGCSDFLPSLCCAITPFTISASDWWPSSLRAESVGVGTLPDLLIAVFTAICIAGSSTITADCA